MYFFYGMNQGAVLSRTADGTCRAVFSAAFAGMPTVFPGNLTAIGENLWLLTGIPVGGPYDVVFTDSLCSSVFGDIYVGDVWLLAGQSNMEGNGRITESDREAAERTPNSVRAYYMDGRWNRAHPLLHQIWFSNLPALSNEWQKRQQYWLSRPKHPADLYPAPQVRGVGPGYSFACKMFELTGIPQAVIPCAVGGSTMSEWTPPDDGTDNFFTDSVITIKKAGGVINGLFWYHGESDCNDNDLPLYKERFEKMTSEYKKFTDGRLLVVQAQIFNNPGKTFTTQEAENCWTAFRQLQLDMESGDPNTVIVPTNDLERDDLIHLSSAAQNKLGKRAADAMYALVFGRKDQPRLEKTTVVTDGLYDEWSCIILKYANVKGKLSSYGFPTGFSLCMPDGERPSTEYIQNISFWNDNVIIRVETDTESLSGSKLFYGYGNTAVCNITDGADRPIPSEGPIKL